MPDPLSTNLAYLRPSETVAISNETKRRRALGEDVIDLSVGEPDFDTPAIVAQAGIQAIQKGMTRYAANIGIPELRAAMAQRLSKLSGGRPVNADNIVVSNGSKQSIFNACFSLFGPRDKVLIPSPAWVSYPQIVHLCRAEPVAVAGDPEWGLKVGVADLERHTDKLVRGPDHLLALQSDRGGLHARPRSGRSPSGRRSTRSGSSPTRSTAPSIMEAARPRPSSTCPTSCWSGWC